MKKIEYSVFLESIISGIPDIIRVFNIDGTIKFTNEDIYLFDAEISNKHEDDDVKNCEDNLNIKLIEAIQAKKMVHIEKYIPSKNRFMDICYSPILDASGEVIFVVERQTDITDNKTLASKQRERENNYRNLVDSAASAVIIIVDNNIVFVNEGGKKIVNMGHEQIIGKNIYNYINKAYVKTARHRMKYILKNKAENTTFEYKILGSDGEVSDVEITSGYFEYRGCAAIRTEIRDITEMKKDLNRASKLQKNSVQSIFPIEEKVYMESIYVPCKTVSGDFYRIHKINEDYVIGIILDVTGKGLSAALNVYAADVLFSEAVKISKKPLKIIEILNRKFINYFDESYISACCFAFDFKNKELSVVGAGINQFLMQKKGFEVEEVTVKGAPLGMFSDSIFSKKTFTIGGGYRFYFFTDGLEFLLDKDKIIQKYIGEVSITQFKNYLTDYIDDLVLDFEGLKDDCTMIALEIK